MLKFRILSFMIVIFMNGLLFSQESGFTPGQAKVTASTLNIRNIPSSGGSVVGSFKRGEILNLIERSSSQSELDGVKDYWYKAKLPKNKSGWVFGAFITFEVNLESGLKWKSVNPGEGGRFTGVAVSANGEVMAGTEKGVVYLTADKGKTWRKLVPQALGNTIGKINKMAMINKVVYIAAGGSPGGGLWRTTNNGASWSQFTTSQGLLSNEVYDVTVAGSHIYAATEKGISLSKDQGATWEKFSDGLDKKVTCLAIHTDGKIIAGTTEGLFLFGEKTGVFGGKSAGWFQIGESSPNMSNVINSVALSRDGIIFAGSTKGLNRGQLSDVKKWTGVGGESIVHSIHVDSSARIIVATDNGLNISIDNGISWVTYKKEHGLSSNVILQTAVQPNDKTIWAVTYPTGINYHD